MPMQPYGDSMPCSINDFGGAFGIGIGRAVEAERRPYRSSGRLMAGEAHMDGFWPIPSISARAWLPRESALFSQCEHNTT